MTELEKYRYYYALKLDKYLTDNHNKFINSYNLMRIRHDYGLHLICLKNDVTKVPNFNKEILKLQNPLISDLFLIKYSVGYLASMFRHDDSLTSDTIYFDRDIFEITKDISDNVINLDYYTWSHSLEYAGPIYCLHFNYREQIHFVFLVKVRELKKCVLFFRPEFEKYFADLPEDPEEFLFLRSSYCEQAGFGSERVDGHFPSPLFTPKSFNTWLYSSFLVRQKTLFITNQINDSY